MTYRIAVIPGDGIGIDVIHAAVQVVKVLSQCFNIAIELDEFDYGADKYLREHISFGPPDLEKMRQYDAILLGALGDPRVPDMKHATDILFGLRFGLDLYANIRPIRPLDARLCPLKDSQNINFTVIRENTEGLYAGSGGILRKGTPYEVAIQEDINTRMGVERIIRFAFEYAENNGKFRVCMSDKSNALRYGHDIWLRTFEEIAKEYPDIESSHLYVDALAMQMVKRPQQFEVIVTCNMFGDIISDLGAQLQGGLGMAPSGNVHPGQVSMFEPVHGSAPKYARKNVANPMAAILTAGMLFDHLGEKNAGTWLEKAVIAAIQEKVVTQDIAPYLEASPIGTRQVADWMCEWLIKNAEK